MAPLGGILPKEEQIGHHTNGNNSHKEIEHDEQYSLSLRSSNSTRIGLEDEEVDIFGSSYQTEAWHDDGYKPSFLSPSSSASSSALAAAAGLPRSWRLIASDKATRTSNPIRNITDSLKPASHHGPGTYMVPTSPALFLCISLPSTCVPPLSFQTSRCCLSHSATPPFTVIYQPPIS